MLRDVQLWIDGKYIDLNATNIRLEEFVPWTKDEIPSLHFTQESTFPIADDPWINKSVALFFDDGSIDVAHGYVAPELNATYSTFPTQSWWKLVFIGQMTRRVNNLGSHGWTYGYEALGVDYMASQWPIVSPFDGTGQAQFNLPPTDTMYDPTYADLSIGEMILMVLEEYTTARHFDDLANITTEETDPDPRDIAIGLGKYYLDTTQTTPIWKIDVRTRTDLLEDPYLSAMIAPKPILFAGDDLLQGIRNILQAVAPNHTMWVEPVLEQPHDAGIYDGKKLYGIIRFRNAATRSYPMTLGMDTDPAPQVQRNYQNSFPRVVVRGGPNVKPVELSLNKGELQEDFAIKPWFASNAVAKAEWKLSVTYAGEPRSVEGTCLCRRPRSTASPNEVSPTLPDPLYPDDPTKTIPNPDYIADITDARLTSPSYLLFTPTKALAPPANSVVPGAAAERSLEWDEGVWGQNSNEYGGKVLASRLTLPDNQWVSTAAITVVDNTKIDSGRCYLVLASPLANVDFTKATLTATRWPGMLTWRRYKINAKMPDGTGIAKRVQPAFPAKVTWVTKVDGVDVTVAVTQTALARITVGAQSATIGFQVDRQTEDIIFDRAVVTVFGSSLNLEVGGADVPGQPTEIRVLLPVSGNALEVAAPADLETPNTADPLNPILTPQYRGTSSTVDKLKRTRFINNRDWVSLVDKPAMYQWATQQLENNMDTIIEGSATRLDVSVIIGSGHYLRWTDPAWDTTEARKFEFLTTDIRGCTIRWNHGNGDVPIHTELRLSNRRNPYADQDSIVFHPCMYPAAKREEQHTDYFDPMSALPRANTNAIEDKRAMDLATKTFDVDPNEAGRLRNAGLGFTQTAEQLGAEAVSMGADMARNAQQNAIAAAEAGTLDGDGQGSSNNFHTASGDIETGYGLDGRNYNENQGN